MVSNIRCWNSQGKVFCCGPTGSEQPCGIQRDFWWRKDEYWCVVWWRGRQLDLCLVQYRGCKACFWLLRLLAHCQDSQNTSSGVNTIHTIGIHEHIGEVCCPKKINIQDLDTFYGLTKPELVNSVNQLLKFRSLISDSNTSRYNCTSWLIHSTFLDLQPQFLLPKLNQIVWDTIHVVSYN